MVGFTVGARYTKENKDFEGRQQELSGLFYKVVGLPGFAGKPLGNIALADFCANANRDIFPNAVLPNVQICLRAARYPTAGNPNPLHTYPESINKQIFNNFSPKVGVQIHPTDDVMICDSWSKGYRIGGWATRYSTQRFKTDYSAIQLNYQASRSQTIDNVGDAYIKGTELEITA